MGFLTRKRFHIVVPALVVLTLVLVGIMIGLSYQIQPAEAKALEAPSAQLPDNAACLSCHQAEGQTKQFPNGDIVSVQVLPRVFGSSAHATISCQVCHTNISGYPHPENSAQSKRDYTLQYQNTCNQCHPTQASETKDSAHTRLLEVGNTNAPICADCHNPHDQPKIEKDAQGMLTAAEHAASAEVCASCHNSIYEEYVDSVHGTGVFLDKNSDVPSCIDCHGVHNISGPGGGPAFRLTSPQICADCHTNEAIMGKYGLSTQVLQTYIADFHGTTVTLFEKTDPDQLVNMPVCYDCHGVHDIRRSDDPEKGLQVKENLLVACQSCHPDATANFPDSWLSHYIPSPDKYPLVYYVGLFYNILIPTVLGGMAIFIASDVYRRVVIDRRKKTPATTTEPPAAEEKVEVGVEPETDLPASSDHVQKEEE